MNDRQAHRLAIGLFAAGTMFNAIDKALSIYAISVLGLGFQEANPMILAPALVLGLIGAYMLIGAILAIGTWWLAFGWRESPVTITAIYAVAMIAIVVFDVYQLSAQISMP